MSRSFYRNHIRPSHSHQCGPLQTGCPELPRSGLCPVSSHPLPFLPFSTLEVSFGSIYYYLYQPHTHYFGMSALIVGDATHIWQRSISFRPFHKIDSKHNILVFNKFNNKSEKKQKFYIHLAPRVRVCTADVRWRSCVRVREVWVWVITSKSSSITKQRRNK